MAQSPLDKSRAADEAEAKSEEAAKQILTEDEVKDLKEEIKQREEAASWTNWPIWGKIGNGFKSVGNETPTQKEIREKKEELEKLKAEQALEIEKALHEQRLRKIKAGKIDESGAGSSLLEQALQEQHLKKIKTGKLDSLIGQVTTHIKSYFFDISFGWVLKLFGFLCLIFIFSKTITSRAPNIFAVLALILGVSFFLGLSFGYWLLMILALLLFFLRAL